LVGHADLLPDPLALRLQSFLTTKMIEELGFLLVEICVFLRRT
jgi:hypothetical protein